MSKSKTPNNHLAGGQKYIFKKLEQFIDKKLHPVVFDYDVRSIVDKEGYSIKVWMTIAGSTEVYYFFTPIGENIRVPFAHIEAQTVTFINATLKAREIVNEITST